MFIDEAKEHLQAMNENLLELEREPENLSIVQNIFRSAHTLKGMSATMGFEDLAKLTHEMENVLDLVRNEKLKVNDFVFDALFQCFDHLEAMVEDIVQGGGGQADVSQIVSTLQAIISGDYEKQSPAASGGSGPSANAAKVPDTYQLSVMQQSLNSGHSVFHIQVVIEESCVLKAARAYMVFNALEQHGEIIHSAPSAEDIEQDRFGRQFSVYFISAAEEQVLRELIGGISEIEAVSISALTAESLAQLSEANVKAQAQSAASAVKEEAPAKKDSGTDKNQQGKQGAQASRTIRVDLDRLDKLMNLFSELLIDRVRLEALAEEIKRLDLTETVEHLARVSSDIQNMVLKLRMVPVDVVFSRFPRMVRDLSKTLNKKVEFVISGADTEMDRTVIDEIGDPLVHLLRNALDHGIETVEERIQAGKPETGTLELRAFHSGNYVFIEIEDDGKGINRGKVLSTAVKRGVVTPEQAEKMSDEEVYQLLFASGFSTAEKISDVSGRGVGLDVVKSKITALGGQVVVTSRPGAGTVFSVQLPLTLSIISALLIRLGKEKYALPLSSIVETQVLESGQIRLVHGIKMIEYRGGVIPVVSLKEVLECPEDEQRQEDDLNIVVIRKGEKMAAVIVDEFIGQQEIVLKTLGKYLTNIFAVSGATILGDGQVALIIDPNALVK
jgi:two-component system chemotaxis sensor kinase CheA